MTREELIAKIDEKVYENENHEVTAESLNEVLKDIVGELDRSILVVTGQIPVGNNITSAQLAEHGLTQDAIARIYDGTISRIKIGYRIYNLTCVLEGDVFIFSMLNFSEDGISTMSQYLIKHVGDDKYIVRVDEV